MHVHAFGLSEAREEQTHTHTHTQVSFSLCFIFLNPQISNFGLVSFGSSFSSNDNIQWFTEELDLFRGTIIAPYWADFSVAGGVNYRISTDILDLYHVATLLAPGRTDFCSFQPTKVVIVSWANVQPESTALTSVVSGHGVIPRSLLRPVIHNISKLHMIWSF